MCMCFSLGGFSRVYASICDYYGQPLLEEVVWVSVFSNNFFQTTFILGWSNSWPKVLVLSWPKGYQRQSSPVKLQAAVACAVWRNWQGISFGG